MVRKIISLTSALSFLITLVTSVILYVVPHGRVAYWADWRLWGLSKEQWGDVHITIGTLFVLALVIHLWLNWKPLVSYMKNSARDLVVLTKPFLVSLALIVFVTGGTLLEIPPMKQFLDFSLSIKEDATRVYGNPPYGHAEQSKLKKFCGYLGFDVNEAIAALRAAGYGEAVEARTEIRELARMKGVTPQQVYEDIRDALAGDPFGAMPSQPPEGLGKLALSDVCHTFGLPEKKALLRLNEMEIKATLDQSLKEIARNNGLTPQDVYSALRGK